jgi:ATP-binding cassette subfamily B protein
MVGRTCVLMVPRLLMARDADHIAVLVDGTITEEGRHDDLVAVEESMYRQLYAAQYGDDRLPPVVGGPL